MGSALKRKKPRARITERGAGASCGPDGASHGAIVGRGSCVAGELMEAWQRWWP